MRELPFLFCCACHAFEKLTPRVRSSCLSLAQFLQVSADAVSQRTARAAALDANARLVAQLDLTELRLFAEARYTHHPSRADLHAISRDHPTDLDHSPSSSLLPPRALAASPEDPDRKTTSPDWLYAVVAGAAQAEEPRHAAGIHAYRVPASSVMLFTHVLRHEAAGEADEAIFDKLAGELI